MGVLLSNPRGARSDGTVLSPNEPEGAKRAPLTILLCPHGTRLQLTSGYMFLLLESAIASTALLAEAALAGLLGAILLT
jgi:hypothetical protein